MTPAERLPERPAEGLVERPAEGLVERVTCDTSVLVPGLLAWHPAHEAVRSELAAVDGLPTASSPDFPPRIASVRLTLPRSWRR